MSQQHQIARHRGKRYQIRHHSEETTCDYCGEPLYVGDYATPIEDSGKVYCSASCETKGERATARRTH